MKQNRLSLYDVEWGRFFVKDIFKIEKCKCSKVSLLFPGNIPYVGATNRNNGVLSFVSTNSSNLITKGNCIAFICDGEGSIGYSIYKAEDFIGSTTVKVGRNDNLNKYNAKFITTIADTVRSKYNFGFKRNENHLKKEILQLPVNEKGNPNWQFMEDYIKQEQKEIAQKVINYYEQKMLETSFDLLGLEDVEWKEFKLKDIFNIYTGRDIIISRIKPGKYPVITHSMENNGIGAYAEKLLNRRLFNHKKTISLADRGNFHAYTQSHDFYIGTRVKALELKNNFRNKYILQFLSTTINKQKIRFSYGFNATNKTDNITIVLPKNKNGEPYWEYMSKFMKKIEAKNLKKVLEYIYIYI